jgi:hypothetical protein
MQQYAGFLVRETQSCNPTPEQPLTIREQSAGIFIACPKVDLEEINLRHHRDHCKQIIFDLHLGKEPQWRQVQ